MFTDFQRMNASKLTQITLKLAGTDTETPVQFTDGHGIPRGPIDGHGHPMAPTPGQLWFSDGPSLIMEKFRRKKFVQVEN